MPQNILIADDEPEVRTSLRRHMRRLMPGCAISTAATLKEAYELSRDETFTVAFVDGNMAGSVTTGLVVALAMKRCGVIVAMSSEDALNKQLLASGAMYAVLKGQGILNQDIEAVLRDAGVLPQGGGP